jgi:hypothetical protein
MKESKEKGKKKRQMKVKRRGKKTGRRKDTKREWLMLFPNYTPI